MYPSPLEKIIRHFSKLPSVGPRAATRFAFHCLSAPKEEIDSFADTLKEMKKNVTLCKICFRSILKEEGVCKICKDKKRKRDTLCVVEKETDLLSIEKTSAYQGIYFVLGGTVSPLRKKDFKKIRTEELKERIKNNNKFGLPKIKEIIIATNQTTEGEATALYLMRILEKLDVKKTRLGRGLSTGSELEYADEETLISALKGRK